MPDETDIIISELSNAPQIDDSAVFPLTQDNGGSPATFKASMSEIAGKVAEGTTFANLQTTSKTLVGALNELQAGGGGGSAELIGTASGSIATFSDGGNNIPMKSCEVAIVAQQASGTPSPSSPLPITGFSQAEISVCGINLWNEDWEQGLYNNQGEKVPNTDGIRAKNPIPVKPSMSYRIIGISGANRVCYYDVNGTFISTETNISTSTTPNNCYFMTFSTSTTYGGTYNNNISINYPSTDTEYHKGTDTTHPVSLGQTIYGGTAELVGGNGTKTHKAVDLGSLTWNYWSGNRFYAVVDDKTAESVLDIICEVYPTLDGMSVVDDCIFCMIGNANQKKNIYIQDDSYSHDATGANNLKTALNGKLAVYRLATPVPFTFTGANIPTLSGVNNVYADSGDVDLEYFNENADEIAELDRAIDYHKYTTAERVVGKWIDGSTLYEKTFDLSNVTFTDNAWNNDILGTASSGILIRKFDGYFSLSGSSSLLPLCYYRKSDEYFTCLTNNDASDLQVRPNMNAGTNVIGSIITIQYTKSS